YPGSARPMARSGSVALPARRPAPRPRAAGHDRRSECHNNDIAPAGVTVVPVPVHVAVDDDDDGNIEIAALADDALPRMALEHGGVFQTEGGAHRLFAVFLDALLN